jgi:hypothetical protein
MNTRKKILLLLTVLLLVASGFCYASNESESLFVQGNDCFYNNQDSLACYYYGQASRLDSSSIILKEKYSNELLKTGINNALAIQLLREIADFYVQERDWAEVYSIYEKIYKFTGSYLDANILATAIFYDGVAKEDSVKMQGAEKIWTYLLHQAFLKHEITRALLLINSKIQARYNALLIFSHPLQLPSLEACWNSSKA